MKSLLLSMPVVLFSTLAFSQEVVLPSSLQCRATSCVFGDTGSCDINLFSSIKLTGINMTTSELKWGAKDGRIGIDEFSDKVTLDFSTEEQINYFTFRKADIAALQAGRTTTLPGLLEDGRESEQQGYRTVALFAVSCSR